MNVERCNLRSEGKGVRRCLSVGGRAVLRSFVSGVQHADGRADLLIGGIAAGVVLGRCVSYV